MPIGCGDRFIWQRTLQVRPVRQLFLQTGGSLGKDALIFGGRQAVFFASLVWMVQHHSHQPLAHFAFSGQAARVIGFSHLAAHQAAGVGAGYGAFAGVEVGGLDSGFTWQNLKVHTLVGLVHHRAVGNFLVILPG